MEYMTYNYFDEMHGIWLISMKCMVYGSKYEAIPLNAVAVPGRVGMAECSLDLILVIRDRPFFSGWVGGRG